MERGTSAQHRVRRSPLPADFHFYKHHSDFLLLAWHHYTVLCRAGAGLEEHRRKALFLYDAVRFHYVGEICTLNEKEHDHCRGQLQAEIWADVNVLPASWGARGGACEADEDRNLQ